MKYIKQHTTIPLPEVYDFSIHYDSLEKNPIGYPYIMMEALDGRTLIGKFENIIPLKYQDKVLSQLADYRDQLSSLRFSKIGRLDATETPDGQLDYTIKPVLHPPGCHWRPVVGPFTTSIDYFFTSRKLDYEETVRRWPNDSDECFAAWLRWQAAVASVDLDFNRGPFPLHHLDLRMVNVLFDDEYNVSGILDWSYVMTVPVEVLANFQHDLGSKYCRQRFIEHLKHHESRRDPNTPYANYFASQEPGIIAIFPLQELTNQRNSRMRVAKELLTLLYGKSASWGGMKRAWRRTSLYKVPKETMTIMWVLTGVAMLAVLLGAWIMADSELSEVLHSITI
jgi:Phosphotransferase enzyme family